MQKNAQNTLMQFKLFLSINNRIAHLTNRISLPFFLFIILIVMFVFSIVKVFICSLLQHSILSLFIFCITLAIENWKGMKHRLDFQMESQERGRKFKNHSEQWHTVRKLDVLGFRSHNFCQLCIALPTIYLPRKWRLVTILERETKNAA